MIKHVHNKSQERKSKTNSPINGKTNRDLSRNRSRQL